MLPNSGERQVIQTPTTVIGFSSKVRSLDLMIGDKIPHSGYRMIFASGDASCSKVYPENNFMTRQHFVEFASELFGRSDGSFIMKVGDWMSFIKSGVSVNYKVEDCLYS